MKNERKKIMAVCLCIFLISTLFFSACRKNERTNPAGEFDEKETYKAQDSGGMDDDTADAGSQEGKTQDGQAVSENDQAALVDGQAEQKASDIPAPSVCGRLSVKGSRLVDERGEAVQLKGISTHGLAWFPQYVNEELVGELKRDWKANVLRLAMYTAESGGYCTDGDKESLKELVKKGVEYATAQDMYVIVDWHILSDGNPGQYKEEALAFWGEMSKEFSDHNNVLYEICNEPNGDTSWADIKSYAGEVIPVIRANAPDAVILVGTPGWSQYVGEAAADPITEYGNIMYTLHFYAATHTGFLRNAMAEAIDAGLPVFVSEFGICDASGNGRIDEAQAKAWVQLMNQYKVSYVAWNLSNKAETSAVILSSVDKVSGFSQEDLSESGRWLRRILSDGAKSDSQEVGTAEEYIEENSGTDTSEGGIEGLLMPSGSWESNDRNFFQYTLTVKNNGDQECESWAVKVKFNGKINLSEGWNGKYSVRGDTLYISSMDYNGKIASGGTAGNVGFILSGASELEVLEVDEN